MNRKLVPIAIAVGLLSLGLSSPSACGSPDPVSAKPAGAVGSTTSPSINTSPDQNRIRVEKDPTVSALLPQKIQDRRSLVVATTAGAAPLSFHATDDNTVIGSEIDLAQLVADKLGLSLDLQVTSWESWPLKTQSGAYNLVFSNVGINDERKKLFLISRAIAPHIWASSQPARHRPSSIQQMM